MKSARFLRHAVFLAICLNSAGERVAAAADPDSTSDWQVVWSDEFDYAGAPDPSKWNYEMGMIRNREKQFYARDRRENARVEVRAKLPEGRGVWPAIWMMGVDTDRVGWPARGEIDIMEFVGFKPDTIHANVHTRKYNHVKRNGKGSTIQISRPFDDFHVYAVEWDARRMDFFVDGREYFSYENEGTGTDAWPFDKPQYLIMNIAIGGSWGGQKGIDDSIFPQRMVVDYVRVYQRPPRS